MQFRKLIAKYRWSFLLMLSLLLLDASILILFPLFIGYAIDDALVKEFRGATYLGLLGLAALIIGAGRRFYDSRFYAKLYQRSAPKIADTEQETTVKSAHFGFLGEVIEFFENSLPEIINNSIALIGTLVIIATIDLKVFTGCLIILLIVSIVYGLSEKKTIRFNASFNQEVEKQVGFLGENNPIALRWHFSKLMKWNIKLSDLETINFSIIWLFMIIFLVGSILVSVWNGMTSQGLVFALVLYVFQFLETTASMPIYYQQWLRLKEIFERLSHI